MGAGGREARLDRRRFSPMGDGLRYEMRERPPAPAEHVGYVDAAGLVAHVRAPLHRRTGPTGITHSASALWIFAICGTTGKTVTPPARNGVFELPRPLRFVEPFRPRTTRTCQPVVKGITRRRWNAP